MARTRVRRRRLIVGMAFTAVAGAWAGPLAGAVAGGAEPVGRSTYVVERGDSLWSIATELAPGSDPRPVVDAIARANDVAADRLTPGEILVVPAA